MLWRRQQGFTLIELIVVIVLLGIMAAGAGYLISTPIEAYSDQVRRQQLVDSAEMAMHRIELDIHRALPNSVRVIDSGPGGWALEMINTVDGARYRDEAGGGFSAASEILSFTSPGGDQQFNLLGTFSGLPLGVLPINYRAVIYSTSSSQVYADAADGNNPGIITGQGLTLGIDAGGTEHNLMLTTKYQFKYRSPTQRLFIVDGAITYLCDSSSGYLQRFDGYGFVKLQASVDSVAELLALGAQQARVATQVSSCNIDYVPGSPLRSGLITLDLALADASAESVRLLHQVHVDNVP
jgi:MSHA biogenesis protein MshO